MTKHRWHVYQYMKEVYMASGHRMTKREVMKVFGKDTPREEIQEGIAEFRLAVSEIPFPAIPETRAQ